MLGFKESLLGKNVPSYRDGGVVQVVECLPSKHKGPEFRP
jgi:hypothetical protein